MVEQGGKIGLVALLPHVIPREGLLLREMLAAELEPADQVALEILVGGADGDAQVLERDLDALGLEQPCKGVQIKLLGVDDHTVHIENDGSEREVGLCHGVALLSDR